MNIIDNELERNFFKFFSKNGRLIWKDLGIINKRMEM